MLLRGIRKQAEHGEPDQEPIGLRAGAQAEGDLQGAALRGRQPRAAVEQPDAQLMQPRERQLHLPFRTSRADDAPVICVLGGVLE